MSSPERLTDIATAVERIFERTGPAVVAAAPLGLGKPNRLINALYARIKADPARSLLLMTALSLARPVPKPGLEARFAQPFLERHFGDYAELDYVLDRAPVARRRTSESASSILQSGLAWQLRRTARLREHQLHARRARSGRARREPDRAARRPARRSIEPLVATPT